MASNTVLNPGSGGDAAVTKQITHDGDTAKLQGVFVMGIAGTEDSYTAAAINGDVTNGLDVDVTRLPALVAGTANIGDVDVLTLPSIPAGTNNIGDVDVLTLPGVAHDADGTGVNPLLMGGYASAAAPTGVSGDGDSVRAWHLRNGAAATVLTAAGALIGGDATNGLDVDVTRLPALVAGTANIGDVDVLTLPALPAGTNNIGDVDVLTLIPGVGATNLGKAEDAAHTSGDTGVMALAVRRDANTTLADTTGDYAPLQVDATGNLKVAIISGAGSGGTSIADGATFTRDTTSVTPVGAVVETSAPTLTAGDAAGLSMTTGGAVRVALASGGVAGLIDDAAYTPGTTEGVAFFATFDDTSPDSVDEGDAGALRMSANRTLYGQIRDAAGNERGANVNSSNALLTAQTGAIPAGTNNIGDVDVLTLPALAAGTNNIGDVDVLTLPALPAGSNNIGDVDVLTLPGSAHDAAISGNPMRIAARALTADFAAVAAGDTVDLAASILGKQITLPYALPGATWNYAAAAGGLVSTTGVTARASAGAGIRNYITGVQVINSHATIGTEIVIRDGAAGTVLHRGWAQPAGGGYAASFDPPLRGTAATLVEIAEVTATATAGVLVNLQGFSAGE